MVGGNDPAHDLTPEEKDKLEVALREEARKLRTDRKPKLASKKNAQAAEISRRKSKRAHQGTD